MKKKGQITIFLIGGLAIVILAGMFFYLNKSNTMSRLEASGLNEQDARIVQAYAYTCIKIVSEGALFNKTALQGGYIAPYGDSRYSESGISIITPAAAYQSGAVPYYTNGFATEIPSLEEISKKISNYISVEAENCFKKNPFREIGYIVTPVDKIKSDVSINEEDISVHVNYTLRVEKDNAETVYNSYTIIIPIRLKKIYESAVGPDGNGGILKRIKDAQSAPPNAYSIVPSDCPDSNTNVYVKNSDDGQGKIIQFVDFSTYYEHYFNAFIFQFAVKGVQVYGNCAI